MSTAQASAELGDRLQAAGFRPRGCTVAGRPALVGRRTDFRWEWFATRLHTFVVVFALDGLDQPTAETLATAAQDYAIKHKGGLPRGLQTGSVAVPVFVTGSADAELRSWFARKPKHRFAALVWPVLLEVGTGTLTSFTGAMSSGRVYQSHLRGLVDEVIQPPARAGDDESPGEPGLSKGGDGGN